MFTYGNDVVYFIHIFEELKQVAEFISGTEFHNHQHTHTFSRKVRFYSINDCIRFVYACVCVCTCMFVEFGVGVNRCEYLFPCGCICVRVQSVKMTESE